MPSPWSQFRAVVNIKTIVMIFFYVFRHIHYINKWNCEAKRQDKDEQTNPGYITIAPIA